MDAHIPAPRQTGVLMSAASLAFFALNCPQVAQARPPWANFKGYQNPDSNINSQASLRPDDNGAFKEIYTNGDLPPLREVGTNFLELYSGLNEHEWNQLGIYGMKMESNSGLTCADVNWEQSAKEGFPSMSSHGNLVSCPEDSQYMTDDGHVIERCVKFLYLNAFPGNKTQVFMNGERLFNSALSKGFHLSGLKEIPKGTIEVTCQLDGERAGFDDLNDDPVGGKFGAGVRFEGVPGDGGAYTGATPGRDAWGKYYTKDDDDRLSTIGTAIMRTTGDQVPWTGKKAGFQWEKTSKGIKNHDYNPMYPFDDQGFFTYYMQMNKKQAGKASMTAEPTPVPSPHPSASEFLPSKEPSLEPTSKPSMTPTPLPTLAPERDVHPHLITMTDGPYATQWGFNQTKMDNMLDEGTVIFFINAVARNFTRIENWDNNCTDRDNSSMPLNSDGEVMDAPYWRKGEDLGTDTYREVWQRRRDWQPQTPVGPGEPKTTTPYVPHIFYNRTYTVDKSDHATICVENFDTKYKHALANVSFLDLSMAFIKTDSPASEYLNGWLTLHALPDIMPTTMPSAVPTFLTPSTPVPTGVGLNPTSVPSTPAPSSAPIPEPTSLPTMKPTDTRAPSPTPTAVPTLNPTISSYPTDIPTTSAPTSTPVPTSEPDSGDPACNGDVLAKTRVYFEPGRIWYVGITGSFKEDDAWEEDHGLGESPEKTKRDYGLHGTDDDACGEGAGNIRKRGDYGPCGGTYFMRGINYQLEVIDEYGGPSQAPTTMPTFGETPVYVPSELITDPLKAQYENFVLSTIVLFGCAVTAFMCTRCAFNALEKRPATRWFF